MKMVRQIYLGRGTSRTLLNSITTTNLTATDLNGDGSVELIGSFVLATKAKARRDLLLIAEPQKGTATFKAALVDFQSYKLPPEEFDSARDFIDQLDLDGDNVAEVFVQQHGFDGYAVCDLQEGAWSLATGLLFPWRCVLTICRLRCRSTLLLPLPLGEVGVRAYTTLVMPPLW
jgi:hypothetical protein